MIDLVHLNCCLTLPSLVTFFYSVWLEKNGETQAAEGS